MLSGRVDRRLSTGQWALVIDPVRGVSARPFPAVTQRDELEHLAPGLPVSARAGNVDKKRWVLLVHAVRPV